MKLHRCDPIGRRVAPAEVHFIYAVNLTGLQDMIEYYKLYLIKKISLI